MNDSRRQKRVSSLIKEALGKIVIHDIQDSASGLITITRVEVSADLKTARVYLSAYGEVDPGQLLDSLEKKKGYLRKALASAIKLKYNPTLIFALDKALEYEDRIDRLIRQSKKDDQ